MRIPFLILLAAVCACTVVPSNTKNGLPGRRPLMDTPDRPDAFMVLVYEADAKAPAERVTREVHLFHDVPVRLVYESPYWRVVMGDFPRKLHAEAVRDDVRSLGYLGARIIPLFRKGRFHNP